MSERHQTINLSEYIRWLLNILALGGLLLFYNIGRNSANDEIGRLQREVQSLEASVALLESPEGNSLVSLLENLGSVSTRLNDQLFSEEQIREARSANEQLTDENNALQEEINSLREELAENLHVATILREENARILNLYCQGDDCRKIQLNSMGTTQYIGIEQIPIALRKIGRDAFGVPKAEIQFDSDLEQLEIGQQASRSRENISCTITYESLISYNRNTDQGSVMLGVECQSNDQN
ncbi:MAG: hypothetical protein AAF708_10270 [Deinococcota bacterium]